ncbi:hypothetical protein B0H13DRAFT_2361241 [Mycena leptocephala]|nr:hypothetical protein B0H13DRAFT_2361241 [Mycena leptocephala]
MLNFGPQYPKDKENSASLHRHIHHCMFWSRLSLVVLTHLILAVVELVVGMAQTVLSYKLRSFLKVGETKLITTVQFTASLACNILITICSHKSERRNDDVFNVCLAAKNSTYDPDGVVFWSQHGSGNAHICVSLSSTYDSSQFLALPDTFWFFLGLASSSKLYMNGMLTTYVLGFNTRRRIRDKIAVDDKG